MRKRGAGAIEVFVTWGAGAAAHVLGVAYVEPGESFVLGETADCDALLPFEALGVARCEIVAWRGEPRVFPPPAALVWVGGTPASAEATRIDAESAVEVAFGPFTVRARWVGHEALPRARSRRDGLPTVAVSAIAHLACLAALATARPASGSAAEAIARAQVATMRRLLEASTAREDSPVSPPLPLRHAATTYEAATVRAPAAVTRGVGRATTEPSATIRPEREAVASRDDERRVASQFGMVALVQALKVDPGEEQTWKGALARLDAMPAKTMEMFADDPIGSFGVGGLRLSGVGEGGGGKVGTGEESDSLELVQLTAAARKELATMDPGDFAHVRNTRPLLPPGIHPELARALPIPEEQIARLVRTNAGRFHACQSIGLRRKPRSRGARDRGLHHRPLGRRHRGARRRGGAGRRRSEEVRRADVPLPRVPRRREPRGAARHVSGGARAGE